ncbi:hypothetical protein CO230_02230 [Chryseobacterium sp. 6424]|uniref:EpsG family protein n=1 Tax=Chryseobacterium sp. 6424 TaxID=2039166 RepID=UPI000EFB88EE|nr:EpsG family protein [Chryseobacterium sp. 6424]AYO57049.1 hypothetical protein CO230_02230 [Chryseobacterium sp. 6424]
MNYKFSFIDLWPYLIISMVFLLCIPYVKRNKSNSILIFYMLLVFTIFRYNVGWDYEMYVQDIKYNNLDRYEILSKLIFSFTYHIGFYPAAFIIFGFLILFLTKKIIDQYSVNTLLSWAIFYSYPQFFFASLSTLRQSLAGALIFYSYKFCVEKKIVPFLISIGLASMFHSSGLLGIILYPLVNMKSGKTLNIVLFASSFFISEMVQNFVFPLIASQNFNEQVKFYIEMNSKAPTLLPIIIYTICIFNIFFYKKLIDLNPANKNYIFITTVGGALYNILLFEPNSALRISSFFLIFWVFIFPYYGFLINKKVYKLNSAILVLLWFAISYSFLTIYIINYGNKIIEKISFLPYKFWFNNL